jgi:hypothetical protein
MPGHQTSRALLLCGALAPLVFTSAWVTGSLVQKGYSIRREDISALAALDAEHPWIMIAGLAVSGALTVAFAVGLRCRIPRSTAASALVALAGLAMIALGLLRNDCSTETAACKARVEAGAVSWHHHAHDALSGPVFAVAVLAPLLLAPRLRGEVRLKALAAYSVATSAALAVLFALGGLDAVPGWDGAVQRAGVSLAMLWMEVVALRLLWPTSTAAITPALRS